MHGGTGPAPTLVAAGAARAAGSMGTLLLVFGAIGIFIGALLSGLCLIEGGVVCAGTSIGSMGGAAMGLGALGAVVGVALLIGSRKTLRAAADPRVSPSRSGGQAATVQFLQADLAAAKAVTAPASPGGPVVSECPRCGGPIEPDAASCAWCGVPFR